MLMKSLITTVKGIDGRETKIDYKEKNIFVWFEQKEICHK